MTLSVNDLIVVYKATFEARSKWENILLELGLSAASIDAIGVKCAGNPDNCYREGLKTWLEGGERSWRDLVEALSSLTVGHKDIAEEIKRKYLQSQGDVLNFCDAEQITKATADLSQKIKGEQLPDLRPSLTLKWRKGTGMPVKMGTTVQSVVIGDTVYIGGGQADSDNERCTVMKIDPKREQWTTLPQYNAYWFAMTSLDDQLVLVGGRNPVTEKPTNQIATLQGEEWTQPYPPMNTARIAPTAVSFNNHIIVAGGWVDKEMHVSTPSVEIFDVIVASRWCNANPLLNPRAEMKSILIGSTLYLMGGSDHIAWTKVVDTVDLDGLIDNAKTAKQATPTLWQTIEDTPLYQSAPLSIRNSLFAVGGGDVRTHKPSSSIHLYQPDIRSWVKVGELPTARVFFTCSVLPNGEIIVAGGSTQSKSNDSRYLNTVDFVSIGTQ